MTNHPQTYRRDIDGLRAIAVLLVVAFHAEVPMADAGFIGVDVFFVLSGFLITGILLTEHDDRGTIRLGRFWTRRIRRLVPAATLTTVATLVLTYVFLPVPAWADIARTGASTVLYYANFHFAGSAADYFASDVRSNPLLHFWSLAVEEQFYLVWPVVVLGSAKLVRRLRGPQWTVALPIGALTLASFGYSLWLTAQETPLAYYSSASRAWEFGVGGLVAVLARHTTVPGVLARYGSWVGLAIIGAAMVGITEATAFPGTAALLPVVGTAICCFCLPSPGSAIENLLTTDPALWLGKISYSLYLWHWPFLVIGQRAIDDSAGTRLTMVALSVVVAAASHAFLEDPVRHLAALKRSVRLNVALGVSLIAVGLMSTLALDRAFAQELEDPFVESVVAAADDYRKLATLCSVNDVALLREDCAFGAQGGSTTILLLGDSHASQWTPLFDEIGRANDAEVILRFRGLCPAVLVESNLARARTEGCAAFQEGTAAVLEELQPDVVVLGHIVRYVGSSSLTVEDGRSQTAQWGAGVEALLDLIDETTDAQVLWFHDQPTLYDHPIDCLIEAGEANADVCNPDQASLTQLHERIAAVEKPIVASRTDVVGVDAVDFVCDGTTCDLWEDGVVRYADRSHLTGAFVESLFDDIEPIVDDLLAR